MKTLSKSALHTLRYFRRGYARDPNGFYIVDECTPWPRVAALLNDGLIESCEVPGSFDQFRITTAGLEALS